MGPVSFTFMMRIPAKPTTVYIALLPGPDTWLNKGTARGCPLMSYSVSRLYPSLCREFFKLIIDKSGGTHGTEGPQRRTAQPGRLLVTRRNSLLRRTQPGLRADREFSSGSAPYSTSTGAVISMPKRSSTTFSSTCRLNVPVISSDFPNIVP